MKSKQLNEKHIQMLSYYFSDLKADKRMLVLFEVSVMSLALLKCMWYDSEAFVNILIKWACSSLLQMWMLFVTCFV